MASKRTSRWELDDEQESAPSSADRSKKRSSSARHAAAAAAAAAASSVVDVEITPALVLPDALLPESPLRRHDSPLSVVSDSTAADPPDSALADMQAEALPPLPDPTARREAGELSPELAEAAASWQERAQVADAAAVAERRAMAAERVAAPTPTGVPVTPTPTPTPTATPALGEAAPTVPGPCPTPAPSRDVEAAAPSVDDFERQTKLAEGAYGVVYKGRSRATGATVAMKKIKMERESEGFPITALRELRLLKRCRHPNIVALHDIAVGHNASSIWLIMEYVEHDLKELQERMRAPFEPAQVKCLMIQLLAGVAHLSENNIVHRDIKPANLLLTNSGILKIGDFGLARPYSQPLGKYTHPVVTLHYRSPELLFEVETYGSEVDVWSVGIIFAELLDKGRVLIPGDGELEQIRLMFALLGSPTDVGWPGWRELPAAKGKRWPESRSQLRTRFPYAGWDCLDLMQALLTYDPAQRITAAEALKHKYFVENPKPTHPRNMPTFPVTSRRRESSLPQAPSTTAPISVDAPSNAVEGR